MERRFTYKTAGTCSRYISFSLKDGKIASLEFEGGCDGNLKGISRLALGMEASEVISRLEGLPCGDRPVSCPSELARFLREAVEAP